MILRNRSTVVMKWALSILIVRFAIAQLLYTLRGSHIYDEGLAATAGSSSSLIRLLNRSRSLSITSCKRPRLLSTYPDNSPNISAAGFDGAESKAEPM